MQTEGLKYITISLVAVKLVFTQWSISQNTLLVTVFAHRDQKKMITGWRK
jgi:hypothetical protein